MIKNSRDKIPFIQQGKMEENENRKDQLKASLSKRETWVQLLWEGLKLMKRVQVELKIKGNNLLFKLIGLKVKTHIVKHIPLGFINKIQIINPNWQIKNDIMI